MQIARNKTMATLIALFLVLTITVTLVALPVANAHTPKWIRVSHIYAAWSPATVGVNQPALIIFWSNWIPQTASGERGDRWKFTLTVTKPDGTTEPLGPYTSDPVGGGYATYTPTQVGTYSVVCHFPESTLTGIPGATTDADVNDTYLAADSEPAYLTVQQEAVKAYVETPLPTGYWTRPIYGANRYWYEIASNWLGSYAQQNGTTTSYAYGAGPESAHVLWTRSYWTGGVMDHAFPAIGYYTGLSYETFGSPSIILEGQLYYPISGGSEPGYGWYDVDLYTGETIYYENNTLGNLAMPSIGEVLDIENPNQHGGMSYLWRTSGVTLPPNTTSTTTWELLDGFTGKMICKIANVSATGTQFRDAIGSVCYVNFVNLGTTAAPNYRMQIWNSTDAIQWTLARSGASPPRTLLNGTTGIPFTDTGNSYWTWRPQTNTPYDGRNGYSMNVSVASILGPRNTVLNETGTIQAVRPDQFVIVGTAGQNDARGVAPGFLRAYSLKPGNWGNTLWDITFTPPKAQDAYPNNTYEGGTQGLFVDPEDGVFFFWEPTATKMFAYSIDTGQQLWERKFEEQFSYYGLRSGISGFIYNGTFFSTGYTGVMHAIDVKTGERLWNWSAPDEGLGETWYPYSPTSLGVICDGKAYMYSSEHSPTMPLRRDVNIWCVDLETGKLVWKMSCWAQGMKIADGRLVVLNLMDNAIYCLGKGPSATTVTASPKVSVHGNSVLIEGTVTDQSPSGRHNVAGSLDFALKGTPAISDDDMEAWMEYMFQQRPIPTNAKGVEVTLDAIDPNNNFIHIGTTTSDLAGAYGFVWTPEVPGTYQIIATFAGSAAYGSSFAQTYMGVGEAPPAVAEPEPAAPLPPFEMYTLYATIAIIIAVAIVGLMILRKKP